MNRISLNISARDESGAFVKLAEGQAVTVLGDVTRPGDREELREVIVHGPVMVVAGEGLGEMKELTRPVWVPLRALREA